MISVFKYPNSMYFDIYLEILKHVPNLRNPILHADYYAQNKIDSSCTFVDCPVIPWEPGYNTGYGCM